MNETHLSSVLERASRLMNDEYFNNLVEKKCSNVVTDKSGNIINKNGDTFKNNNNIQDFSSKTSSKGIPTEILESFKKTPVITNNESFVNTNVLDRIIPNKTNVNEQNMIQQQHYNSGNGVDYTIIKAIVNECISNHLSSFRENLINESIVKGFTIKDGNKIQFLSKYILIAL